PGADPVPGPAALVHPGCADGERQRVRRAPPLAGMVAGLLLAWSAAAPAAAAAGPAAATPAAATPATATPAAGTPVLIDDFEDASRWSAHPADGVAMKLSAQGAPGARALRIDFRFAGGGGYAVARREIALTLPENYAFGFRIRGRAPANHLEFKLIDSTGANVWWCNRRNVVFPRRWQTVTTKRRQITFAWGPAGGGTITRVAALEIAITAGRGGRGTVWLDQ